MNIAVLAVLLALQSPATVGQEPALPPRLRYDALVKDGEITWRCWWDGPSRPICKQWNVRSLPTVYVLDRAGVIRFTNRRGTSLDHAVMTLLEESPRPKS